MLVFPVYWLFITAISPLDTLRSFPPKFWPDAPQWQIFSDVVQERPIGLWLGNSALAAIGAVAISMAVSILAGYSLSRFTRARRPFARPVHPHRQDAAGDAPRHPALRHLPHARPHRQPVVDHPRARDADRPVHDLDAEGLFRHHPARARTGGDGRRLLAAGRHGARHPARSRCRALPRRRSTASSFPGPTTPMRAPSLPTRRRNWTANLGITTMKGEYVTDWNEISAAVDPRRASRSSSSTSSSNAIWSAGSPPARRSDMAGIRIENVRKSYGALTVVKDFSLDIARRRIRRARRPIRLRQVDDAQDPRRAWSRPRPARVLIGGRDVTDLAPGDRDIAMVFQNYALYPHLTVRRNMGFGLKMRGMAGGRDRAPRPGGCKDPRHRASARPPPEGALRRPAAKGGARPRHRARAAGLPDGRAAVEPRREAARPHPRRDQRACTSGSA